MVFNCLDTVGNVPKTISGNLTNNFWAVTRNVLGKKFQKHLPSETFIPSGQSKGCKKSHIIVVLRFKFDIFTHIYSIIHTPELHATCHNVYNCLKL